MQVSVLAATRALSCASLMAPAPPTRRNSQLVMSSRKNMPRMCSRFVFGPSTAYAVGFKQGFRWTCPPPLALAAVHIEAKPDGVSRSMLAQHVTKSPVWS